jgi:hypothetical protein
VGQPSVPQAEPAAGANDRSFYEDVVVPAVDWLRIPQTRLLGITQGAVLVDPDGDLAHLRRRLAEPHVS